VGQAQPTPASQASGPQQPAAQRQVEEHQPAPAPAPYPRGMPAPNVNLVNEAIDRAAPLTPEEVRALRKELGARKTAMTENVTGRSPARPTTTIYNVDLSPGATPPVVRVEQGQGSIVSFLDAAGHPWPARVADNFGPGGLTVSQFTEHQLSIGTSSATPINAGVAVALEGLPVAITFSVISGQTHVDSQVHMVLPRYRGGAPNGVGVMRGEPSLAAGELMAFLLRTPPATARSLTVEGLPGALAWQISPSRMVLRTAALVTTGYFRSQGLGDGTVVYELPLSPVVRVVVEDQLRPVRLGGFITGGAK
jgi:intracellular multiplication protein IcmK